MFVKAIHDLWFRHQLEYLHNYRTLQFIVSPHIGSLSDKYGRKNILLLTMIGNILSALVYVSRRFFEASVMLTRPFKLDTVDIFRILSFVTGNWRNE